MADPTYQPKVYRKQGGNELVVASGGAITIEAGGSLVGAGGAGLGIPKLVAVAGVDETMVAEITVTGMAVGDRVDAVMVLTTAAAIATLAQRALTDFTVAAGKLTIGANAANNAANQYLIMGTDLTP